MFMDGADKKVYGYLLKKLQDDYSLGDGKYPEDLQEALQVLQLYAGKKKNKKKESEESPEWSGAQVERRKCHKCGKKGHLLKDCPGRDTTQEQSGEQTQSQTQSSNAQVQGEITRRMVWRTDRLDMAWLSAIAECAQASEVDGLCEGVC